MSRRRLDLLGAALCIPLASAAAAQELYFEGGVSFARGGYVYTQRTNGGGAMAGLAWSSRPFTARVTLPYFLRDTRVLEVRDGTAFAPADGSLAEADYEGSLADPLLQVSGEVHPSERTALGLSASVKVPLVEAGDFGTGQWDFGGAASLSRLVGAATLVGLDVSYWRLGDMPELPLQDTVTGTLTLGRGLDRDWTASASLSGGRSAVPGYDDPWWAGLLLGRSFTRSFAGLTASVGLSDGAPDFTVGLVWRARID